MTANPLVVSPEDSRTWSSGSMIIDDGHSVVSDISNHSWVALGLESIPTAVDAASLAIDPIGTIISMGAGWLLDHINPLKKWLDELAGNKDAVTALGETYQNIAGRLSDEHSYIANRLAADLEGLESEFLGTHRDLSHETNDFVSFLSTSASATGSALDKLAILVDAVHGIVRDAIAQLVGTIASALIEEACTLGLGTGAVIGQVTDKVATLSARVSKFVDDLAKTIPALGKLIKALEKIFEAINKVMAKLHMRGALPKHEKLPGERTPHEPTPKGDDPKGGDPSDPKDGDPSDPSDKGDKDGDNDKGDNKDGDEPPSPKHRDPGQQKPDPDNPGQLKPDHWGNIKVHVKDGIKEMPKDAIPADIWAEGSTAVAAYIAEHGKSEGGE